jgi:transmembrane sensor
MHFLMEQRIKWLIAQITVRVLDSAEQEELAVLLAEGGYDEIFADAINDSLTLEDGDTIDKEAAQQRIAAILALDKGTLDAHPKRKFVIGIRAGLWARYAAAALIVAGMSVWYLYYYNRQDKTGIAVEQEIAAAFPDVRPGGDKAVLTLDDGSTVLLDSTGIGLLSQQGQSNVIKIKGGELAYQAVGQGNSTPGPGKVYYNTITVPRGGQFKVVLPDGSSVWLNAFSSLRFPTTFVGPSREVFVTGEAYFEIAADAARPFFARVEGLSVEVLGTSFDINAYKDEKVVKATLLKGKVRVSASGAVVVMTPGQQAEVAAEVPLKLIDKANTDQVVAWKNKEFYLDNTDIATLMRQIGRWYAIEVAFEGATPAGHITGKVPMNTELPKMLRLLKASGVHFRIEEKKIVVFP